MSQTEHNHSHHHFCQKKSGYTQSCQGLMHQFEFYLHKIYLERQISSLSSLHYGFPIIGCLLLNRNRVIWSLCSKFLIINFHLIPPIGDWSPVLFNYFRHFISHEVNSDTERRIRKAPALCFLSFRTSEFIVMCMCLTTLGKVHSVFLNSFSPSFH